ncbi:hypothetical protein V5799_011116 [Amblyomma americanum]|uniref:Uncharacterized protein n=1 Tax=Amblyomma americanum TaxID=6943 RepID=A0AAQ4EIA2_AMBAM
MEDIVPYVAQTGFCYLVCYIAAGQDIKDIALAYRVGIQTARVTTHFCCRIIRARLKDQFMNVPSEGY